MTARAFGDIAGRIVANRKPGRRTEQPVRRNSYDVNDRRARVFRPIGDGTKIGAIRWRERYLLVAEEYDVAMRKKGERCPLGAQALRILRTLLKLADFKTGQIDPCLDTIQKLTGYTRKTVVAALARLRDHGFLNWVRRTERTNNEPGEGPAVKQASNAYFFDLKRLSKRAAMRLTQLVSHIVPHGPASSPTSTHLPSTKPANLELEAALARIEATLEREDASSLTGQNPGERD